MKSRLIIEKNIFSQKLSDQIKSGNDLLKYPINNLDNLEVIKRDYKKWSSYNEEILKQSFSEPENEYRSEYKKSVFIAGKIGNFSVNEKSNDLKDKIQKRIYSLESILSRVDLFPT